ncbi:hypothetical protein NSTC731_03627 [Nostoc sp. DSM 114167]|jgi:hypothetical protein
MFEKCLIVIFIALLPPLVPPYKGGKQEKSGSLPFLRGGLGWGKKYLIHQSRLFKQPLSYLCLLDKLNASLFNANQPKAILTNTENK